MTLACSTAPTFLFRWFVRSLHRPSSLTSASRLVTALSLTPTLKVLPVLTTVVWVVSATTATVTTDVLRLRTLCDSQGCCGSGCPTCPFRPPSNGGSFFMAINRSNRDNQTKISGDLYPPFPIWNNNQNNSISLSLICTRS